jgi:predicted RNase H-like nuclease
MPDPSPADRAEPPSPEAELGRVVAQFHRPDPDRPWREELRRRSVSARGILTRHPVAAEMLGTARADTVPEVLADREAVVGCLRVVGLPVSTAGAVLQLLDAHLLASVRPRSEPRETEGLLHLAELARDRAGRPDWPDEEFERGLDLVLDAVADLLTTGEADGETAGPEPDGGGGPVPLPEPLEVLAPVLGIDGCRAGWVGALLVPGAPRPRVVVAPTVSELVETVRGEMELAVVGIDIPIGLPDDTTRRADALARTALPGRASSVFTTLTRAAYGEQTRSDADEVNRRLSGQGVGAQAFALGPKILEVDAWVRSRPTVEVLEVHPEVSFAAMAGGPVEPGKKTDEGRAARLAALAAAGIPRPSVLKGSGYDPDDVLDACAVAWTAARRVAGLSHSLPDPPEVFSDGIPAAIHV